MKCGYTIEEKLERRKRAEKYAKTNIEPIHCGCKNGNCYRLIPECTSSSYNSEIEGLTVVSHYRCTKCGYTMRTEDFEGNLVLRKISKY